MVDILEDIASKFSELLPEVEENHDLFTDYELSEMYMNHVFSIVEAGNHPDTIVEGEVGIVEKVMVHPIVYAAIRQLGSRCYADSTKQECLRDGVFGWLWQTPVHVNSKCPRNFIYLIGNAGIHEPGKQICGEEGHFAVADNEGRAHLRINLEKCSFIKKTKA